MIAPPACLDGHLLVHRRPHFTRRGASVFFLVARNATLELSAVETLVFDAIDGIKTVAELTRLDAGALGLLQRGHAAHVFELETPDSRAERRHHIVVLEPHIDDAVLSAGGRIFNRRADARVTVLSATSLSNFTSYWFLGRFPFDLQTVTRLRTAEGKLACRLLGAEHQTMPGLEGNLRFVPAALWNQARFAELYAAYYPTFFSSAPLPDEVSALATRLRARLEQLAPDELWIPMGLGRHVDHRLTRDACLLMLTRDPSRFPRVEMYEDLPYAHEYPEHAEAVARLLRERGAELLRETEDVSGAFDTKMRAASVFGSQWKIASLEPTLRAHAQRAGARDEVLHEAYYKLTKPPLHQKPGELGPHPETTRKTLRILGPWLASRHTIDKLVVFAIGPFGRFELELRTLMCAFPKARLSVFVHERNAWQVTALGLPGLTVRILPASPRAWLSAYADAWRSGASATIIVRHPSWETKYRILHQAMRFAAPSRRVLLVSGLCEAVAVAIDTLELELGRTPETAWPEGDA